MTGWRMAHPEDRAAMEKLYARQERVTGWKADRPDPFRSPVLLAMVYERDGVIVDGFYFEAIAEMVRLGVDAEATQAMDAIAEQCLIHLRMRGLRYVRVFVPRARHLARKLAKYLVPHGFRSLEGHVHFYRKIEEASDGA